MRNCFLRSDVSLASNIPIQLFAYLLISVKKDHVLVSYPRFKRYWFQKLNDEVTINLYNLNQFETILVEQTNLNIRDIIYLNLFDVTHLVR